MTSPPSSSPPSRARPRLSPRDVNTTATSYFGGTSGVPAYDDSRPSMTMGTGGDAAPGGGGFNFGGGATPRPKGLSGFAAAVGTPLPPSSYSAHPPQRPSGFDFGSSSASQPASSFGTAAATTPTLASHSGAFKLSPSLRQHHEGGGYQGAQMQQQQMGGMVQTPLAAPSGPSPFFPQTQQASSSSLPNPAASAAPPFKFVVPPIRKASAPSPRAANPRYTAYTPASLISMLSSTPPTVLVLDLRAHSAWNHTRLKDSINVCVPSTLLRRQTHTVENVAAALNATDLALYSTWREKSAIVVLDGDSMALTEQSGLSALLAKFVQAGATQGLGWVRGGFGAVRSECLAGGFANLLGAGSIESKPAGPLAVPGKHARPVLQVRDLPVSAFQLASTSAFAHSGPPTNGLATGMGEAAISEKSSTSSGRPNMGKRRKSGAEGFPMSLGMRGGSSRTYGPGTPTPAAQEGADKKLAANPFFDNIRQNQEALSLERSLANLTPIELPDVPREFYSELPPFLTRLLEATPEDRAKFLARQYYDLEVAERERLEGALHWHANHQGKEGRRGEVSEYQKFGIHAGVELGSLNRFKNIFPYEHARVRLQTFGSGATDYINASHVSLPASPRRFIASQGPLQTTYPDFWQMCDQENVGVIIMLTNLHEGGREKCGRYWVPTESAGWDLKVSGGEEDEEGPRSFFSSEPVGGVQASTIRREIELHRQGSPPELKRKIRHIHYRAWPDFDIPAQPSDVVALVREVDKAQRDYLAEIGWQGGEEPPIMAHCSAGVGRTGVFIMVSSMLEKLVRERKEARESGQQAMDVDGSPSAASSLRPPPLMLARNDSSSSSGSLSPIPPSPGSSTSELSISAHLSRSTLNPSVSPSTASFAGSSTPTSVSHTSSLPPSPDAPPLPLDDPEPILAGVNSMREHRMSMVATYRQYVCVLECVLVGMLEELEKEKSGA